MRRFLSAVLTSLAIQMATRTARASTEGIDLPMLVDQAEVDLPPHAALGTERLVARVELLIDERGNVIEAVLIESFGEVVDQAILSASRRFRFEPARVDGNPRRARIVFQIPLDGRPSSSAQPQPEHAPTLEATSLTTKSEAEEKKEIEVVVTGSRLPERRDRSVVSTEVISREEIERTGATTVGEALEARPSLQISRTFRGTELWIRGLDPEYTLILIDGQQVPGRIGGAIDLSRLSVVDIERIEVVRGPSSALYGSDAIGGVVNIITRRSTRPLEVDAQARVATENAAAASGRVSVRPTDTWGASVHASHEHTAAFRRDPHQAATSGSARTLNSIGASTTFGNEDGQSVRLSVDYSRTRLEGVDEGSGGAVFDRTQLQEQSIFTVNHRVRTVDTFLQSVAQFSHFRDQYLVDQREAIALDSYEQNLEHLGQLTTTVGHEWTEKHRTTLGVEMLSQILDSPRLSTNGQRMRYSAFGEHRWVAGAEGAREILTIVPGVRLDVDSQFGNQLSPKLAARADPTEVVTLRAGYGRGFRAPSFQELLLRFENQSVGYVVEGNPELEAESSHSGDVSVEWRPTDAWMVSVAGFYNSLSNMIATVTSEEGTASGTVFTYENIASAWTRGAETVAMWSPHQLLALTMGYTFMQTRDGEQERPLVGRPIHRVVTRSTSRYEPWGVSLSARGALSLQRTFFEDPDADGREKLVYGEPLIQVDVQFEKEFSDHLRLFFGIDNLANAGDAYASLLPRQAYAGLRGSY